MFHINSFVLIFLHQVVFSISFECFPVAFEGVNCTITRKVTQTTLVWKKDGNSILSSTYQATNSCIANPPSTEYAEYCFDDSTQKVFVLEILNPENHAGSNFSDGITGELTTINLMEPNNLSSGDLNITYTITADTVDVSVIVPCCNPQPTFTWNFKTSKSVSVENSQTSTDSTGCASSLLKRLSSLSVNLKTLDSEFTQTSGYFEISVDVKFGDRKTVSSVPITVKYNAPGTTSVTPDTTLNTTVGVTSATPDSTTQDSTSVTIGTKSYSLSTTTLMSSYSDLPVPECCCYNLVVLIITAVLVLVSIILVIVHFSRREAKKEGNVYWVINVGLILDGLVCLGLAIAQILYVECIIVCEDLSLCSDKSGHGAAIAFIVLGFIVAVPCIVLVFLRLIQRGQRKDTNDKHEMKPGPKTDRPLPNGPNTEPNGTSNRPRPLPAGPNAS